MYTGHLLSEMNNAVDRATGTRPIYAKETRTPVAFYMDITQHDRLLSAVEECNTSISAFCRQAIAAYLEELERQ